MVSERDWNYLFRNALNFHGAQTLILTSFTYNLATTLRQHGHSDINNNFALAERAINRVIIPVVNGDVSSNAPSQTP